MRVIDCEQGTPEWLKARSGIVTASGMGGVVTAKKLLASTSTAYINKLAAERVMRLPVDAWSGSQETERGKELEPRARAWYALEYDQDVQQVGFCVRDDGSAGCSPDGLCGSDGGVEIKVPFAHNHVGNVRDPDAFLADHRLQVQTCLWVTGRDWWDLVSWHPTLPCVVVRSEPDPDCFAAFAMHVPAFNERLESVVADLRVAAMGIDPSEATADDYAAADLFG